MDLAPGETITLHFDMDNVFDNWQFYVKAYYYSEGQQPTLQYSGFYTIIFPEEPEPIPGDVNGDGVRNIGDVTRLINFLLGGGTDDFVYANADVDGSGNVSIGDVTALINLLLNGVH